MDVTLLQTKSERITWEKHNNAPILVIDYSNLHVNKKVTIEFRLRCNGGVVDTRRELDQAGICR